MKLQEIFKGEFESGDLVYLGDEKMTVISREGDKFVLKDKNGKLRKDVPIVSICAQPPKK